MQVGGRRLLWFIFCVNLFVSTLKNVHVYMLQNKSKRKEKNKKEQIENKEEIDEKERVKLSENGE